MSPFARLVAAHGITDVLLDTQPLMVYAAVHALPRLVLQPAFLVASADHFALDVGRVPAYGLVGCCVALNALGHTEAAMRLMAAYMAVVHLPRHAVAVLRRHGPLAWALWALCSTHDALLRVPWDGARRLVVAHTIVTRWAKAREIA